MKYTSIVFLVALGLSCTIARNLESGYVALTTPKGLLRGGYGANFLQTRHSIGGQSPKQCQCREEHFFQSNIIPFTSLASTKTTKLFAAFEETGHGQDYSVRTDVEYFLTQRAVQSFMLLCAECRDPHTIKWLDSFGNTTNLLEFYGTGGLNPLLFPKWDSYLLNLIDQNKETITVRARRRGAGSHGWSKNNPYIQDRFVNYYVQIDPLNILSRIITVREQLAEEWLEDLDVLVVSGDSIMDSYMANVRQSIMDTNPDPNTDPVAGYGIDEYGNPILNRNNDGGNEGTMTGENEDLSDTYTSEEDTNTNANVDDLWSSFVKGDMPAPQQQQQDDALMNDITSGEPDTLKNPRRYAFDRNGPFFLRNKHAFRQVKSSPLRGGSFDLLVLLSTQEAIIRLLRKYRDEMEEKGHIYEFLRDFYVRHLPTTFDGSGEHGRADDFLELLMIEPPRVSKSGREVTMIDPLGLAEKLIQTRKQVALEWMDIITNSCPFKELDDITGDVMSTIGAPSHEHIRRKLSQKEVILKDMALSEDADDLEEEAISKIEADVTEALALERERNAAAAEEWQQEQIDDQEENGEDNEPRRLPFGIPEAGNSSNARVKSYSPWSPQKTPVTSSTSSTSSGLPYGPPLTSSQPTSNPFDNNQNQDWGEFQ